LQPRAPIDYANTSELAQGKDHYKKYLRPQSPRLISFWVEVGAKVEADLLSEHLCKSDDPGASMGQEEEEALAVVVLAVSGLFYRPW